MGEPREINRHEPGTLSNYIAAQVCCLIAIGGTSIDPCRDLRQGRDSDYSIPACVPTDHMHSGSRRPYHALRRLTTVRKRLRTMDTRLYDRQLYCQGGRCGASLGDGREEY